MDIDAQTLLIVIIVGVVAGWVGVLSTGGTGVISQLLAGMTGAFCGNYVFSNLDIRLPYADPLIAQVVVATIGAIILVNIARAILR
jgi:uncharacterized membrane protein YeaQ/YmgE (transglycosylase-associated protein family)